MATQIRTLDELTTRASGLMTLAGNLQSRIIDFAATRSPDATKTLTSATLENCGYVWREAEAFAKAARWAAVIRRDFGEKAFKDFIAKIKSTE